MKRHIGAWYSEADQTEKRVGELIFDGNHIEFFSRFTRSSGRDVYVGDDGDKKYKVFVEGINKPRQIAVLENSISHRVLYVLEEKLGLIKELKDIVISGISELTFTIPELVEWIGVSTVAYEFTSEGRPAARERSMNTMIIHDINPRIELYYESRSLDSIIALEDDTTITIKQIPRIKVVYDRPSDIVEVAFDIECLMQFFGLLIGKVSIVDDIRISFEGQQEISRLYINHDYSYNKSNKQGFYIPRTYCYVVEKDLSTYYSNWYRFCCDENYSLLRRVYFGVNNEQEMFLEDIFVEYMRILDGYHIRAFGDAEKEKKIKEALKGSAKAIKEQLFIAENQPIFEEAIQKALPDWKFNSSNVGDISEWIAAGYLAKKPLAHRLKELDKKWFGVIENNAESIVRLQQSEQVKTPEETVNYYFKALGDTRNYYSHYKQNKTGVLNIEQIRDSVIVLKALINAIYLSQIGIENDTIRRMLVFDVELYFTTEYLKKKGEKPYSIRRNMNFRNEYDTAD